MKLHKSLLRRLSIQVGYTTPKYNGFVSASANYLTKFGESSLITVQHVLENIVKCRVKKGVEKPFRIYIRNHVSAKIHVFFRRSTVDICLPSFGRHHLRVHNTQTYGHTDTHTHMFVCASHYNREHKQIGDSPQL